LLLFKPEIAREQARGHGLTGSHTGGRIFSDEGRDSTPVATIQAVDGAKVKSPPTVIDTSTN